MAHNWYGRSFDQLPKPGKKTALTQASLFKKVAFVALEICIENFGNFNLDIFCKQSCSRIPSFYVFFVPLCLRSGSVS